jgi:glucosamine--fructose-6-phosphate aminotransferase (isomerizing)
MNDGAVSLMLREAREAPEVVAGQLGVNSPVFRELAVHFARVKPRFILTNARGSSNNAATYAKYLVETRLGLPVVTAAPSVGALYRAPVNLNQSVMLCLSQSGASFDLVENAKWAASHGAFVISLLNTAGSALGAASRAVVPLHAGSEHSVAATKSHIATLSAVLQMVANFGHDPELLGMLNALPEQLRRARALDWSAAVDALAHCNQLFVVARGIGLGVAQEAALKFKETCGLNAEAFSGAELLHGPVALIREHSVVLLFGQKDETAAGVLALARQLRNAGAVVYTAGVSLLDATPVERAHALPFVRGIHPVATPLALLQAFYGLLDVVARSRGFDPDKPPHLMKVTQTL